MRESSQMVGYLDGWVIKGTGPPLIKTNDKLVGYNNYMPWFRISPSVEQKYSTSEVWSMGLVGQGGSGRAVRSR